MKTRQQLQGEIDNADSREIYELLLDEKGKLLMEIIEMLIEKVLIEFRVDFHFFNCFGIDDQVKLE